MQMSERFPSEEGTSTGEFDPVEFVEAAPWTFARSMPTTPHFWTKRGQSDIAEFEEMVGYIRENGFLAAWFPPGNRLAARSCNVYLEIDEWRYWTMGWRIDETIIINREQQPGSELFNPFTAEPLTDEDRGRLSQRAIRAAFGDSELPED